MRVVIAVHHFPPRYRGGAELRALRTARALQARGHDVRAVVVEDIQSGPAQGVGWDDDVHDGIPVRRLRYRLAAAPDPFRFEYDNLWIGEHLDGWLEEQKPDLLHLFSGYLLSSSALRAAQQHEIATVVSLTDYWFLCRRINLLRSNGEISTLPIDPARCARCYAEERRRHRILGQLAPRLMDRFWSAQRGDVERFEERRTFLLETLNSVDTIISPSQFLRSVHVDAGVPAEKITFSRQGNNYASVDPLLARKSTSPALRLGYIGQIAPHKGIHVLIEALQQVRDPQVRLHIYGEATQFPDYAARIRRMAQRDSRCVLGGSFSPDQLTSILRDIDILVVPSLWYENSPNVILEAFAHRTPVVVSDLGGMAELVEDGRSGLHFAVGDATSLAEALRRLLQDPALQQELRAGVEAVRLPSVDDEIDELERLYRETLARRTLPEQEALDAHRH